MSSQVAVEVEYVRMKRGKESNPKYVMWKPVVIGSLLFTCSVRKHLIFFPRVIRQGGLPVKQALCC